MRMADLQRNVDKFVGGALVSLFSTFKMFKGKRDPPVKAYRAAFIKLWAIGDSVVALPAICSFKKANPNSRICVVCRERNKAVFQGQDFIDEVIAVELCSIGSICRVLALRKKFDLAFDLEPYMNLSAILAAWTGKHSVGFSGLHRASVYDRKVDFRKTEHMSKNYFSFVEPWAKGQHAPTALVPMMVSRQDAQIVQWFMQKSGLKKGNFTCICPIISESAKTREWPSERFAALAELLLNKNKKASIVFIGGRADKKGIGKIIVQIPLQYQSRVTNAAGLFSVQQSAELMRNSQCVVSNDTGPMHIAAAMGARTVGLFGPNTPDIWAPLGRGNIALYHKPWCSPCIQNIKGVFPKCFNPCYQQCMKLISVDEVFQAVSNKRGDAKAKAASGRKEHGKGQKKSKRIRSSR